MSLSRDARHQFSGEYNRRMYESYTAIALLIILIRIVTLQFPESLNALRHMSEFNMNREEQKKYDLLKYIIGDDDSFIYITGWSVLHFTWGIFLGVVILIKQYAERRLTLTNYIVELLIIHSLWELYQLSIEITPYWTKRAWWDISTDTVMFMIGTLLPYIATSHTY